jgi:hypothetical protein
MLRPKVSRPVRPGTKHRPWAHDQISTTVSRGPLPRRGGSAAHNRYRPSPAQSISGPIPSGPATTFHLLRFYAFPFVISHDSQGQGGGSRPLLYMGLVTAILFKLLGPECDIITCVSLFVFDHTENSGLLKKLLYLYSTEVNLLTKCTFCFPHNSVHDVSLVKIILTSFLLKIVLQMSLL